MTNIKSTKRALLTSVMALFLCFTMLLGTTFAWFTDSVTSAGNKIQAGTLEIDLELLSNGNYTSVRDMQDPIFDYEKWEPGYTEIKTLKIKNEGNLALKYQLNVIAEHDDSILANVIDVYMCFGESTAASVDDLQGANWWHCGTLAEMLAKEEGFTQGKLLPVGAEYDGALLGQNGVAIGEITASIALHMQETAGNEYQGLDLGNIDITLIATQFTYESDSYDDQYDAATTLDWFPVSNQQQFMLALETRAENIVLEDDIPVTEEISINYDMNINGNGHVLARPMQTFANATVYTGVIFQVADNATLELENIIIDGGAIWTGEINPVLERGTENIGVTATGALISAGTNSHIILGEGAVLQNNDGANAVSLNTRTGSTLTLNGGEILNNHSAAGAIWGGGEIIINDGKVNGNHGGLGGAIRAVTNIGTLLTMNGGEMNHNYSDSNGGAIWAGSSRSNNVYVLNGGEMAYNYSATTGGAIYAGYYETVKIGGTFKMHDNGCAANIGSAIRFHDHASLVMTGGEVYNHDENAFFLYNNSASITGGKYVGDFGYSGGLGLTLGMAEIDGVISYSLGTNHNTAYLAKDFGSFEFTVNETAANFASFNFQPASDYVYTEGDEEKLVCLNEGYETYWDAATSTFRLQAAN